MSLKQKKLEAKMRQAQIQSKRKPLQESGSLPSQWGGMTSDAKLIERGHFKKSSERAELDFLREKARKLKAENSAQSIVIIKK